MSMRREVIKLIREYEQKGWRFEPTRSGHWRGFPPDGGPFVVLSGSPRYPAALANMRADLKRCERQPSSL
jgi:hypothetical protein